MTKTTTKFNGSTMHTLTFATITEAFDAASNTKGAVLFVTPASVAVVSHAFGKTVHTTFTAAV